LTTLETAHTIGSSHDRDAAFFDIYSACEGLCVQASYADYINYPKAVNGNEAVAGFLWATAIVERPAARKAK
jgi:hypothetical protein